MHNSSISTAQEKFLKTKKRERCNVVFGRIVVIVLFLILWEYSAKKEWIDPFFFSSPSRIIHLFGKMIQSGELFPHIGVTLLETILSFILCTVFSLLIALFLLYFPKVETILEPYLVILNALPKSALAPLIIVWLGTGIKTIIIAGMSVAIFGSIIHLYNGFQQVDPEKLKLIQTLGGGKRDILLHILIPSTIPLILSNMKVNIGLSLVGVIIGEFLAARIGLGYLILYGSQVFQLDVLILSIFLLCLMAGILYFIVNLMVKLLSPQ